MRLLLALTLAATFSFAPFAFAHTDGGPYGTPKTYCEDVKGDQLYHDYGPLAIGQFVFMATDGTLTPCPYGGEQLFDGHYEFAQGGAILVADEGDFATYGSAVCGWPYPDHPMYPTVWVFDHEISLVGASVSFWAGADALNNVPATDPSTPNCGDFETDFHQECVDHCIVGFPPGLDGTYSIYVHGSRGHVWTSGR